MKARTGCIVAMLCCVPPFGGAWGATLDSHVVAFDLQAINEVFITGGPSLTVDTAVAGQEPTDDINSTSSYAITTNGTSKRLTASIDVAMPTDITLQISLAAPTASGTSAGYITLTTTAADVVTGITKVAESGVVITYKLSATASAGVMASDTRIVTLTMTD